MGSVAPSPFRVLPPSPRGCTAPCRWQWLGSALADLGVVLHVYAQCDTRTWLAPQAPWPARRELVGLVAAERVVASVTVDSDGPSECLRFLDGDDAMLASLWLLPDSDFLAWETLLSALPGEAIDRGPGPSLPRDGRSMQARVVSLARTRVCGIEVLDARPPGRLSMLGAASAHRLASAAQAVLEPLPHDCCCQHDTPEQPRRRRHARPLA